MCQHYLTITLGKVENMSQEEIRVVLKKYLSDNPVTKTDTAKRIGIALITLQGFLHGLPVRNKIWLKLNEFVQELSK